MARPPSALDETFGSCGHCTLVQFGSGPASFTYVVPSSGVLTKVQVFVGGDVDVGDWVQARTFSTSGTPNARVISQGAQHSLAGLTRGARTFYDRVPATAGDVLGGRFHVLSRPEATPVQFPTGSAADVAGISFAPPDPDPGVGDLFAVTAPVPTQQRVNMFAVLESDADGDGYGDTSQDLCPGDGAATIGACSGALFGSRLQGPHTGAGSCGFACMRIQKTVGGTSTAAAVAGVVVRWRLQAATGGSYRVRVVVPAGGSTYTVLRSGAAETVPAPDPSPLKHAISTFATRLPIPAGGYVALVPPPFAVQRGIVPALGANYAQLNDAGDGMVTSEGAPIAGELFYDADIEPDADHDGHGDVTQDACPSVAATQGACPPRPAPVMTPTPAPVPPDGGTQPTSPRISGLEARPARFRVKRRGAVIARARAGTRIRLRLSEPATVGFALHRRRAACRPARTGCARWRLVHVFARGLPAGPSAIAYSGRYRRGGSVRSLRPGRHRLRAVATDATGRAGGARRVRLTVRP